MMPGIDRRHYRCSLFCRFRDTGISLIHRMCAGIHQDILDLPGISLIHHMSLGNHQDILDLPDIYLIHRMSPGNHQDILDLPGISLIHRMSPGMLWDSACQWEAGWYMIPIHLCCNFPQRCSRRANP